MCTQRFANCSLQLDSCIAIHTQYKSKSIETHIYITPCVADESEAHKESDRDRLTDILEASGGLRNLSRDGVELFLTLADILQ